MFIAPPLLDDVIFFFSSVLLRVLLFHYLDVLRRLIDEQVTQTMCSPLVLGVLLWAFWSQQRAFEFEI